MKSGTYPLAISDELLTEVRATSVATGLSMADAMRQSMKLGLPSLRKRLVRKTRRAGAVKPFTKAEAKRAFGPDREWDKLERAMACRPVPHAGEDQ
jgi:hypothetical protein